MDAMNAKQLFDKSKRVTEADETPVPPGHSPGVPPPGRQYPPMPRRPLRARDGSRPAPGAQDAPDIERVMGREEAPKGQFSGKELSQLKDVVILMLAHVLGSDMDKQIGMALAQGQPIEPGLLQHIVDEARNAKLPESHWPLMDKLVAKIAEGQ